MTPVVICVCAQAVPATAMYAINAKTKTHRRISMFLPLEKGPFARLAGTISAAPRPFKGKLSAVRLVQNAEAVRSRAWVGNSGVIPLTRGSEQKKLCLNRRG